MSEHVIPGSSDALANSSQQALASLTSTGTAEAYDPYSPAAVAASNHTFSEDNFAAYASADYTAEDFYSPESGHVTPGAVSIATTDPDEEESDQANEKVFLTQYAKAGSVVLCSSHESYRCRSLNSLKRSGSEISRLWW